MVLFFFFFQAEDGIRDGHVTGVQTCALPIWAAPRRPTMRCSDPADMADSGFSARLDLAGGARLLDQVGNPGRDLGAVADPVVDPLQIDAQPLFLAPGNGVEETDALDEAAVARRPAVGDGHMVKRTLLGAPAC